MAAEIERKFLLQGEPEWLGDCPSRQIEQGYLVLADDGEVRVRRIDGGQDARLTVKRGEGRTRRETEVELIAEQATDLWPATEGRRVCKRRFRCEREEGVFEIDVYEGELAGLIVCEIEFARESEAESFTAPDWVDAELTDDERYKNRALARDGLPADLQGAQGG